MRRKRQNEKACKYIDELNIQKGWELQHGLNGGEKQVGPYFLDGYDEKRNIAFEYFEKAHHKNHKKEERDVARARYIKKELNCKFFFNYFLKIILYISSNEEMYIIFISFKISIGNVGSSILLSIGINS